MSKRKKKQELKGFIQSGMLFIGDPGYMAGDMSAPGSEEVQVPNNPFHNFEIFSDNFGDKDINLHFRNYDDPQDYGRGVLVASELPINAKYLVKKKRKEDGTIEIKITIKP